MARSAGVGLRSRRWVPWSLLAVVVCGALAVAAFRPADAVSNDDRVRELAATFKCPTCRGQSVLESDAPAARNIRNEIARRVEAGETDDDIGVYLVSRYGASVVLNPPADGVSAIVWILPVAGFVLAAVGLGVAIRRWRVPGAGGASEEDRALVAELLAARAEAR